MPADKTSRRKFAAGRGELSMKSHARVVVIGGGVVGVSTLYHLARKGWSDVVLVEKGAGTEASFMDADGA